MGFCRRCGDIVAGDRCKCGGAAVAPVVPWEQTVQTKCDQDKWSKTYVLRARSVSPTRPSSAQATSSTPSPSKRFPRPVSQTPSSVSLDNRVFSHIASSTTDMRRPPSPSKYAHAPAPEVGILPSLNDATLSKVYGSVLQPKETLATHSCALCSSIFPPDATIYPDPVSSNSSRFLCRPCYEDNGGIKGVCPTCSRPVLTLKTEGPFIHATGQYWHKKCFNCSGCFKNIGDSPMVDLLGRPSCAECFESCLKRDPTTPKKYIARSAQNSPRPEKSGNIGGMGSTSKIDQRGIEGSPTIVELEKRLGISPKRQESPAGEDRSEMRRRIGKNGSASVDGSPVGKKLSGIRQESNYFGKLVPPGYSGINEGHIRPGQTRILGATSNVSLSSATNTPIGSPTQPHFSPPRPAMQQTTPDLMSDISVTTQSSSEPDTPPKHDGFDDAFGSSKLPEAIYSLKYMQQSFPEELEGTIVEETASQMGTPNSDRSGTNPAKSSRPLPPLAPLFSSNLTKKPTDQPPSFLAPSVSSESICLGCGSNLFSIRGGGKFVTIPGNEVEAPLMTYHVECFRCVVCDGTFSDANTGQAAFVKANDGACHIQCASPAKMMIHKTPNLTYTHPSASTTATPSSAVKPGHTASSSRLERPPVPAPLASGTAMFPRFGSRTACPGCTKSVSPMEPGVVPGPQNTRWHASCLVCGGKKESSKGMATWRSREETKTVPGCGKRLDSAAKPGSDGGVWCRECLLLIGGDRSPQPRLIRTPLSPTNLGPSRLAPQLTGTTTIARQFTGLGGADPDLLKQLTGNSLSSSRSISPTKQLSNGTRPRPKSVVGMRSTNSMDEGRGMFLVRQLTGTS